MEETGAKGGREHQINMALHRRTYIHQQTSMAY